MGASHDHDDASILALLEPLARLEERDGTLDGAVPLRVAQACVPLLEGNALGQAIVFRKRLVVKSTLGKRSFERTAEHDAIDTVHRALLPILVARGLLAKEGAWHRRLARGWWWSERGVFRVWTGLLARAPSGTWLRIAGPGNHPPHGVVVRPSYVGDDGRWVPLVIDLDEPPSGTRLEGAIANVTVVAPDANVEIVDLSDVPELGEAHAAFYDAKYFATKKGEVTKKYRRILGKKDDGADEAASNVVIAHIAGPRPEIARQNRVLFADDTAPAKDERGVAVVRFANAVPFSAHYDGNTLLVEPDKAALARGATAVEGALAKALGPTFVAENRGACWYLTKYFTPHPHGEPHFFVKPWAFTRTPRGWSSILDGVGVDPSRGFHVMRGVVWTDRFHATPAVFHLRPLARMKVAEGEPLLDVIPTPRVTLERKLVTRSAE